MMKRYNFHGAGRGILWYNYEIFARDSEGCHKNINLDSNLRGRDSKPVPPEYMPLSNLFDIKASVYTYVTSILASEGRTERWLTLQDLRFSQRWL
jgi:hypothetical protein